jgi:hypothetical protein
MWLGITLGAGLGTIVMRASGFTAVWLVCAAPSRCPRRRVPR